jgi:hypothetical protein
LQEEEDLFYLDPTAFPLDDLSSQNLSAGNPSEIFRMSEPRKTVYEARR